MKYTFKVMYYIYACPVSILSHVITFIYCFTEYIIFNDLMQKPVKLLYILSVCNFTNYLDLIIISKYHFMPDFLT